MPLQPNVSTDWSTGIYQPHCGLNSWQAIFHLLYWICPSCSSVVLPHKMKLFPVSLSHLQIWQILSRVSSYFAWRTNSSEIRRAGTRRIIMQCLPWELILCFTVCCVYNKRAFRTKEREWEPAWARCFPLKPWVTFIVERRLGGGGGWRGGKIKERNKMMGGM